MNEAILVILYIVGVIIALAVLYSMSSAFLKEFEKSCHETIQKKNKEFEENKQFEREFKKWLFGSK